VTEEQVSEIAAWFDRFVASFPGSTPAEQRNYDLKIEHTAQVRGVMERLTKSLDLPPEERALAAAIALCHDVGRFPQYHRYGTFNDATSTNHAALSVRTLKDEGILDVLYPGDRETLLQAVALHNVFRLPDKLSPTVRRFALLIRDADKLDIWRVMIEFCAAPPDARASAVTWELPDTGTCSPCALKEVAAGRMLNRSLLATADDFKLLQLSWVYDLNFAESLVLMNERGYIDTLADLLPHDDGCHEAVTAVRDYVSLSQSLPANTPSES
jgi:hypothetical protein